MDGNVFFLHLPSTDGYGSVFKPPSAEYRANINAVDAGVSGTVYCTVLYCNALHCTVLYRSGGRCGSWTDSSAGTRALPSCSRLTTA